MRPDLAGLKTSPGRAPADEIDAMCDGLEAVAFFAVGGWHRLDGLRRQRFAQLHAHDPVAVARSGQALIHVTPCDQIRARWVGCAGRAWLGCQV